jgi:hypothetical protein
MTDEGFMHDITWNEGPIRDGGLVACILLAISSNF